jgi:hypothetical protein
MAAAGLPWGIVQKYGFNASLSFFVIIGEETHDG